MSRCPRGARYFAAGTIAVALLAACNNAQAPNAVLSQLEANAVAEEITKLLAICVRCGNPAVHTQRLVESEELIVVGASGAYEARCRRCFEPNPALAKEKKEGPQLIARNRATSAGSS